MYADILVGVSPSFKISRYCLHLELSLMPTHKVYVSGILFALYNNSLVITNVRHFYIIMEWFTACKKSLVVDLCYILRLFPTQLDSAVELS